VAETLEQAIQELAKVKAEHRGVLNTIAHDAGMNPETRAMLIGHLYAEEDEHLAEIQALSNGALGPNAGSAPAPTATHASRLSVGSLRSAPPATQTLGSLRPPQGGGLSVGSLRHA
jgi:hypothetical protein